MIGTTIGQYRIVEKIGEGGMGEVYLADDTRLRRRVALKFLPPHLLQDEVARKRFLREAESAAAIEHPYICNIKELGQTRDGHDFIVMEYVEGRTLAEKLEEGGPLPRGEALRLAIQVADAMEMAHEKGLIHRDLKPANIMLTPQGHAKVMDFGLAKRVAGEEERQDLTSTMTRDGASPGTPAYMSPEQIRARPLDQRSDLFSFGIILYEMLTGVNPFRRPTAMESMAAILQDRADPLGTRIPKCSPQLQDTLTRLLDRDPERRIQSAGELQDRLKRLASGREGIGLAEFLGSGSGKRSALGVLGLIAMVFALRWIVPGIAPSQNGPMIASIAVFPFANLSGDASQEFLVEGMTDELTTALSKIGSLVVISRSVTARYLNAEMSLPEVAEQLGVDAVLDGSVLREGDQVRVSARLIQAETGQNLFDESYQRDMTSIMALQGEVARAVAQGVRVTLTPEEADLLTVTRAVDPEAYEAYLQGMFHFRKITPEALELAEGYFQLAIEKDATFAPAFSGLSLVWAGRGQGGLVSPQEAGSKANEFARRAVELDDGVAEAHQALAISLTWQQWRWEEAWDHWRRALEINPNDGQANAYYAHFLCIMGLPHEALPYAERALEVDPFSGLYRALYGTTLVFLRRYDEAIAAATRALELDPTQGVDARQAAYIAAGMREEQLAHQRERIAVDPLRVEAFERGLAEGGYEGAQIAIADLLAGQYGREGYGRYAAFGIGLRYFDGGDHDRAMAWFERAVEIRDPNMPYIGMPTYDPLRTHPRYPDLIRAMDFPPEVTARYLAHAGVTSSGQ